MSLPRVHEILHELLPLDSGWQPMNLRGYFRRGRLTEAAVTLLAQGQEIDREWWKRTSGDRVNDRVEHEECRPYIEGGRRFLREMGFQLKASQLEVVHTSFVGHLDWLGNLQAEVEQRIGMLWIVDLKNGTAPADDCPMDWYERMQLALYEMAYRCKEPRAIIRRANLHLFDGTYRWVDRTDRADLRNAQLMVDFYNLSKSWK